MADLYVWSGFMGQAVGLAGAAQGFQTQAKTRQFKYPAYKGLSQSDILPSHQPYDEDAHALAKELNGRAQVRFRFNNKNTEYDVISPKYVAESKSKGANTSPKFRRQAKKVFNAASRTNREVMYVFKQQPGRGVVKKLNQYSLKYRVKLTIKIKSE